jgi:hypothetical protein
LVKLALDILSPLAGFGGFEMTDRLSVYVWFSIGLVSNFLFGFCWARRHLLNNFRQAATRRYQPSQFGWLAGLLRRNDVGPLRAPVTLRET